MASLNLYKKFDKTTQEATSGGYKNVVFWAPTDTFTAIQVPTPTPAALGDKFKITTAHTFPTDEGFISWLCKQDSVTIKGVTIGDPGSNEMEYTSTFILLGDGAATQEEVTEQLNSNNLWLLKDSACLAGNPYVQLGNECVPAKVSIEFDGKTTAAGLKEYTITVVSKAKAFYSGTITEKPVPAP